MAKPGFGSGFSLRGSRPGHHFLVLEPGLKPYFFSCRSGPGSTRKNSGFRIPDFEPGSITQKIASPRIQFKDARSRAMLSRFVIETRKNERYKKINRNFLGFFNDLFILTNKNNIKKMNPSLGFGFTGYPKPRLGPGLGLIRVIKIHSGSGFFYTPVRVQPVPDYPGSSRSGPDPGYFAIPN